jgi:DinB family protein
MTETARVEAQRKAREYLRTRGTLVSTTVLRGRIGDAFAAFAAFLATVPPELGGRRPTAAEWSIQEIVDHVLETYRAGLDELRCLLAGERPPAPPIPAALVSRAARHRPWPWLLREMETVQADVMATLESAPADLETAARAPVVMVINANNEGGETEPIEWVEELDWKAYAIVSWRLHAVDHLHQAERVLAALRARVSP